MEIKGKVHCFFEQSGTFKSESKKLGYEAEDYDIQNNFGETDNVVDLFAEIEKGFDNQLSIFDKIGGGDLILAFFPCIHFCDAKTMFFKGEHIAVKNWSVEKLMKWNLEAAQIREDFYKKLLKLVSIVSERRLRIVIENPWNTSRETYLQCNFLKPTIIDTNRSLRGDYFVKPTAYWFFGCAPTYGKSFQINKNVKIVYKEKSKKFVKGQCSEERSMISPDYARNFICDFIIGKEQQNTMQLLF